MLQKTRGIVFKTTDYSESSVIVQVFTEKFGLQSYLINGVKRPRAKIHMNLLQPLHLLEMVVYHKPGGNIQRVSELRQAPQLLSIPYDVRKSSIALFLNEVLYKSIRQHTPDEALFEFLFTSIEILDRIEGGLSIFHLYFLMHLTRFLGFYPDRTLEGSAEYFDLQNGSFARFVPSHQAVIHQPLTGHMIALLNAGFQDLDRLSIPISERRALLNKMINYFQFHIGDFGTIKSLQVLEDVLA